MVLPYSVFLVLGTAAPTRAVAHNSYLRLYEYGSTALLSGLWRQAIEVSSCSEFTRLIHMSLARMRVPTSELPPAAITEEFLAKVLKALPQGSTARPSGWTYEHIKDATSCSEDAGASAVSCRQCQKVSTPISLASWRPDSSPSQSPRVASAPSSLGKPGIGSRRCALWPPAPPEASWRHCRL
jgi:hypothetical protein